VWRQRNFCQIDGHSHKIYIEVLMIPSCRYTLCSGALQRESRRWCDYLGTLIWLIQVSLQRIGVGPCRVDVRRVVILVASWSFCKCAAGVVYGESGLNRAVRWEQAAPSAPPASCSSRTSSLSESLRPLPATRRRAETQQAHAADVTGRAHAGHCHEWLVEHDVVFTPSHGNTTPDCIT
jgi:hypothetical protein